MQWISEVLGSYDYEDSVKAVAACALGELALCTATFNPPSHQGSTPSRLTESSDKLSQFRETLIQKFELELLPLIRLDKVWFHPGAFALA